MDAQQMHDKAMENRKPVSKGSKKRLQAALRKKSASPSTLSYSSDPIGELVRENPGLTREKAMRHAEELGF